MSEEKKKKIGPREMQLRQMREAEYDRREAARKAAEKEAAKPAKKGKKAKEPTA